METHPKRTKVSVVIPTLNAGPGFGRLLKAILTQSGDFDTEVVVVDSSSMDETAATAREHGATVHVADRADFGHGSTRNRGIELSNGDYIVLTVQDALPIDDRWISSMVEDLEQDGAVAGVYSRQFPHSGASVMTRAIVNGRRTASPERHEQSIPNRKAFDRMRPPARRRVSAFDNVSSCIRRSVWEEIPFEDTSFGEDLRWGKQVVQEGYKIVYQPLSAVEHSHERSTMYDLRRYYVDQKMLVELFDLRLIPNIWRLPSSMARTYLHIMRRMRREQDYSAFADGQAPILQALVYTFCSQVGGYLGGRRMPEKVDDFLSRGV